MINTPTPGSAVSARPSINHSIPENALENSAALPDTAARLAQSYRASGPERIESTDPVKPQLDKVEGCLNAMIAVFKALSTIHNVNIYHGNPSAENCVFQRTKEASTSTRSLKASFLSLPKTPEAVVDPVRADDDVKIALRDFGGRLLIAAENNDDHLNILKMHLETQVNFADQDEPNTMESAATMHKHLCALKRLISLQKRDYSHLSDQPWGPLSEERVIQAFRPHQSESGRPPAKRFK